MDGAEEEFVPEDEAEEGPALIKKLRDKLKKAVEEKQEYLEGWQRSRADFANYKREEVGLYADREARIKAEVFEKLLPALNALEQAARSPSFQTSPPEWQAGFKKVWEEFIKDITKMGIDFGMRWTWDLPQIGWFLDEDMTFDPTKHEILREIPTDNPELDNKIAEVYRAGYSVDNHVIQPAQVGVYSYKSN